MGNSPSEPVDTTKIEAVTPLAITTIDVRELGDGKVSFDGGIKGNPNDTDAKFMSNIIKHLDESGTPVYEATEVKDSAAFRKLIEDHAKENEFTRCLLYIHGFTNEPADVFEAVSKMNTYLNDKKAFVIPIVWPSEGLDAYTDQKEDAPGAARALRSLYPKIASVGSSLPISLVCHSMGNYVLGQFSTTIRRKSYAGDPDAPPPFKFDNIFMVAADIRATTFDIDPDEENYSYDSEDENLGGSILRLVKDDGKIHVLYNWWDMALLGRRVLNGGRTAIGKVGFEQNPQADRILKNKHLVPKDCQDWKMPDLIGHGYHTLPDALEYYLKQTS